MISANFLCIFTVAQSDKDAHSKIEATTIRVCSSIAAHIDNCAFDAHCRMSLCVCVKANMVRALVGLRNLFIFLSYADFNVAFVLKKVFFNYKNLFADH